MLVIRSMTDKQLERFVAKLDRSGECWLWTGVKVRGGYGRVTLCKPKMTMLTHRAAYEHWIGPIPAGKELDHLCRNRACARPDHLEPVTHLENVRRGDYGVGAKIAQEHLRQQTHCRNGHSYDGAYHQKGSRRCAKCQAAALRRWREKQHASGRVKAHGIGKTHSPATIAKMSEARRLYWQRKREQAA